MEVTVGDVSEKGTTVIYEHIIGGKSFLKYMVSKQTESKENALNCERNQKEQKKTHFSIPWGAALFFILFV